METIPTENIADNPEIAQEAIDTFSRFIYQLYAARSRVESDWVRFINMYNQKDDGHSGYIGRSNIFVPELKRVVSTNVKRQKNAIMPPGGIPLISAVPEIPIENQDVASRAVEQMQIYHLVKMNFPNVLDKFLLQYNLLGNACMKSPWVEKKRYIFEKGAKKEKEAIIYRGPRAKFVSMFDVYFYPDDVCSFDDVTMVIERVEYSNFDIERMENAGYFTKGTHEKVKSAQSDKEIETDKKRIIKSQFGLGDVHGDLPEGYNPYIAYQIWCEHDFGQGVRAYMIELFVHADCCARVIRNPYPNQRFPHFFDSLFPSPEGVIYGQGWGHAIDKLQYLLNDTLNQGMDSAIFLNNPVMRVDLGLIQTDPNNLEFHPGGMIYANREGIEPIVMGDARVVATAYESIGLLKGLIREHGGEPAINQALTGKARSATQAQIVSQESVIEIQDPVEKVTTNVLVPMLQHNHAMIDYYYKENFYIRIIGENVKAYEQVMSSQKDFAISYKWAWRGASSTQNDQLRSMQMINFLNVLGRLPPEVIGKMQIDFETIIKRIWTKGFQLPDGDQLIKSLSKTTDPEIEGRLAKENLYYDVHQADDDDYHETVHVGVFNKLNDKQKVKMAEHIMKHRQQKQLKIQQMMMIQQMQQQQAAAEQQGGQRGNMGQVQGANNAGDMTKGMRMI